MSKPKSRVLVVDDTEATRYTIARTLRANGYETIEAGTGKEALRLAALERPDLITLDIHLPDALGFDICRQIKSNPQTAHIPVLQVSASYVTAGDRIHGLEGGADGYLTHPFDPAVLLATIRALLRGRKLDEDLRLSEERFRVALKNAPIMIYTCDLGLKYTWIYNPPTPLTATAFLGKRDDEIFSPKDAAKLDALKKGVLASGKPARSMTELDFSGMTHYFDLTVEPFRSSAGETIGLTVAGIDVTERMLAEHAQKRAMEEAELANQAKSRFLSNMSHEIRTPLGVIQGFADLALDPSLALGERQEYLQTIRRNAENLTKLLGEILDLAKVEAGRIEIEIAPFSLPTLIAEVVAALSLQARERGVSLTFEAIGALAERIESDPTRIRQILINLINNAVKFTPRGSVVVLAKTLALPGGPKALIEFHVRDTGIGISPEQQARLFQAFSQADSSTTRRFGGTGLGLNLSKKLAQSLGGDLELVESALGAGSVFRFAFSARVLSYQDASPPAGAAVGHAPAVNARELNGLVILLVEDSLDNQMLISRYLQQAGASVDVASDGAEGIDLALKGSYDVILMDVQMPNVDGYEATAALRAKGLITPIVALTAHAMKEERERAFARGFTDYLIKPLSRSLLVKTLTKFHSAER